MSFILQPSQIITEKILDIEISVKIATKCVLNHPATGSAVAHGDVAVKTRC